MSPLVSIFLLSGIIQLAQGQFPGKHWCYIGDKWIIFNVKFFFIILGGLAEPNSDVWNDVMKRNNEAIVWFDDDPLREAVEVAK